MQEKEAGLRMPSEQLNEGGCGTRLPVHINAHVAPLLTLVPSWHEGLAVSATPKGAEQGALQRNVDGSKMELVQSSREGSGKNPVMQRVKQVPPLSTFTCWQLGAAALATPAGAKQGIARDLTHVKTGGVKLPFTQARTVGSGMSGQAQRPEQRPLWLTDMPSAQG